MRWLTFVTEIVHVFHNGYFDRRGAFKQLLIQFFSIDAVCVDSPVKIITSKKARQANWPE